MKDILNYPPPNIMAKVGTSKKEKTTTKKQKEAKAVPKIISPSKINKFSVKKPKSKGSESSKKKTEKKSNTSKKNEEKKDQRKKYNKEPKCEKTSKASSVDNGKKKNLVRKNYVAKKSKDHIPSTKIQKVLSGHCDGNKLVNGNSSAPAPQTTRNPWVLKLDIAPQQPKPVSNGIPSNGTVALCSKSVIFIPKNDSVSGVILKRSPLPFKKEIICMEKLPAAKQPVNKQNPIPNKTVLKNGCDSNCSVGQDVKKKNETNKASPKKDSLTLLPKEQKCRILNGQKLPKVPCHSLHGQKSSDKEGRPCSKSKNQAHLKPASADPKSVSLKHEKDKSAICKHQVCLSSKDAKTHRAKSQKMETKETKTQNNCIKKSATQDKKALCLRDQTKIHPQRMASLDAMAKMHVICSTDRRMPVEASRSAAVKSNDSATHIRSNSQKIHVGFKKEFHEIKGRVIHSRINCIKFEESSVTEGSGNVRTFCSISQEQEQTVSKRPRGRPKMKTTADLLDCKNSSKSNARKGAKTSLKEPQLKSSIKRETKSTRIHKILTVEKTLKQSKKKKPECKTSNKTQKTKIEKKSKVKVKETIRMRKTCTFQSVTTVSSHKAVNSVVSSCSRLGVTTNYQRKKSVVRDQACEKKATLRLEDLQEPFLPALENPCSVSHTSNCCSHNRHSSPQSAIPVAHSQSCHRLPAMEACNTSHPMLCDGSFSIHRCSRKEPVMYHRLTHSCGYSYDCKGCCKNTGNGCCCSSSLVQSMHEPCAHPKETNSCAHSSYYHMNSVRCPPCSCCHSIPCAEHERRFNMPSSSNFQNRWCTCHEPCHSPNAVHQKVNCNCHPTVPKTCASSVPFDQIPLDLSLGASNTVSVEKNSEQSRTRCQNNHYFQDRAHFQSCPHNCQFNHHCVLPPNACPPCWNRNSEFKGQEKSHPLQVSVIEGQHSTDSMPILDSISSCSNDDPSSANLICQEISTIHNYSCSSTKQERNNSTRASASKKRKFAHGWSWEGEPMEKMIALTNDSIPAPKRCYPALRHREGDIIKERDCVLLKSGPKDTDLPYVAKVAAFWENPDDGEMMMSLLWYYRPEHTEQGRRSGQMDDEVFASKHRDVNSVACIEDKCFVLTYNEYCRYRANLATLDANSVIRASVIVPELASGYPRLYRLPTERVSPEMIFFCRHVYDFRQKRILKNPT